LRLLGRYVFREILSSAVLGTLLATCVIFLQRVDKLFELLVGSEQRGLQNRGHSCSPWPCPRCCP
jgi:lipopolysaccharide export LptBFGC system permease protein LptF